jgi:Cu/Ag efflux pump CusA
MPVVVLASFIPFRYLGISASIMSLAGVAIAFSELVDASIVVVEHRPTRNSSSGRREDGAGTIAR